MQERVDGLVGLLLDDPVQASPPESKVLQLLEGEPPLLLPHLAAGEYDPVDDPVGAPHVTHPPLLGMD